MALKVAINGFGRIGRLTFRRAKELGVFDIVAVNDLTDAKTLAHLLKYDSIHGTYDKEVKVDGENISVDGDSFKVLSMRNPSELPWKELGVDIVLEATGVFRTPEKAGMHLTAGAKKVVLSAPAKGNSDNMISIVLGVNENVYDHKKHTIIDNASCTTNCLAPLAKVLMENFGFVKGIMTTIHSYTNDQRILDLPHKDLRRTRAASVSMIPTTTGAAKAVGIVLPALAGKINGLAIRVPTPNVSIVDLVCELEKPTTVEKVIEAIKKAADGELKGILAYSDEPLVSCDFQGNPNSSIVDLLSMMMTGDTMLKVLSWYDNEWGYSCRIVDLIKYIGEKL